MRLNLDVPGIEARGIRSFGKYYDCKNGYYYARIVLNTGADIYLPATSEMDANRMVAELTKKNKSLKDYCLGIKQVTIKYRLFLYWTVATIIAAFVIDHLFYKGKGRQALINKIKAL